VRFPTAAPGAFVPSGDTYVGEWSASATNVGLTQGEVEAWVGAALNDPQGMTGLGVSFTNVGTGGVVFRSVASLPGNAIGMCYYDTTPPRVDLLASYEGNMDLVNHEGIHAFCYAAHSPEGTDSIMEPIEDPGEEWLSETDLSQIAAWLGLPYPPEDPVDPGEVDTGGLLPGLYWYPMDLAGYKTKWDFADSTEVRLAFGVKAASAAGAEVNAATLSSVYSEDPEAAIEDWLPLGAQVGIDGAGIHDSDWQPLAEGARADVYVGVTLEVSLPLDSFEAGSPEIRTR
jgi:hypothetical protein